ncbi:PilW family protein [Thermus thalpophilus]|uniref:PilW family protein n=1 Tax=Thermus thalpophilus TaxID=2908147 RepID=UPI001FA9B4B4|nr:prepilin-type N-terminal cleavage/methylation domain-containing protein [Thermus thalpophilus]
MVRKGFTLVELLVALAMGGILLGLLLATALSNRRLYTLDQYRTAANQNLRAALDLIVADARQAGERLPGDLPAILVRNGNELILRRNLMDQVLALCDTNGINGNQDNIPVAIKNENRLPAGYEDICRFRDSNNNGYDDRIDAWRAYRCASDGEPSCQTGNRREVVRAYIYNPTSGQGEWFDYDAEDNSGVKIHKGNSDRWQKSYGLGTRIYLLEERRYYLEDGKILLAENGAQTGKGVVANVTTLSVKARVGNTWYTNFPANNLNWRQLQEIEVKVGVKIGTLTRELQTKILPRNILSD